MADEAQALIEEVLESFRMADLSIPFARGRVAAEIDKALGGLRKIHGRGHLLPSGILQMVYAHPADPAPLESKQYTRWTSGWTEAC